MTRHEANIKNEDSSFLIIIKGGTNATANKLPMCLGVISEGAKVDSMDIVEYLTKNQAIAKYPIDKFGYLYL